MHGLDTNILVRFLWLFSWLTAIVVDDKNLQQSLLTFLALLIAVNQTSTADNSEDYE